MRHGKRDQTLDLATMHYPCSNAAQWRYGKHDSESRAWREDIIRTYLARDVPQLGPRIPARMEG